MKRRFVILLTIVILSSCAGFNFKPQTYSFIGGALDLYLMEEYKHNLPSENIAFSFPGAPIQLTGGDIPADCSLGQPKK